MKILIADPLAKVRNALSLLLQKNPGWIVSGKAKNPNELISKITIFKPDVLLLDWYLLGEYPTDVIQSVRQISPSLIIIVMSGDPGAKDCASSVGLKNFHSKIDPPERLISTIQNCEQFVVQEPDLFSPIEIDTLIERSRP